MSEPMEFLTLEQLCSVCALERDWLVVRVREGLIPAEGDSDVEWRFTTTTLARVRRMREIERTYDAAPEQPPGGRPAGGDGRCGAPPARRASYAQPDGHAARGCITARPRKSLPRA
jgi:hypothetical protein